MLHIHIFHFKRQSPTLAHTITKPLQTKSNHQSKNHIESISLINIPYQNQKKTARPFEIWSIARFNRYNYPSCICPPNQTQSPHTVTDTQEKKAQDKAKEDAAKAKVRSSIG